MLTAIARDAAGNSTTSAAVTVTVNNGTDRQPADVSMTSPANGATVSGTITVTATASDNVGVVGVQFKVRRRRTSAPRTRPRPTACSWDTTTSGNGITFADGHRARRGRQHHDLGGGDA